jgi:hypothetical protein
MTEALNSFVIDAKVMQLARILGSEYDSFVTIGRLNEKMLQLRNAIDINRHKLLRRGRVEIEKFALYRIRKE